MHQYSSAGRSYENNCKLEILNEGMEPDGLMDAEESEYKGIRVWEDNIKQDICQMKIKNWIACVQDRGKWKDVVEKAKTFHH